MAPETVERRLAAILSADVVGYTRLIAEDELGTLDTLKAHVSLITGQVRRHGGRVVDAVGDNLLAEFRSAVDAVECAIDAQHQIQLRNESLPDAHPMQFRMGITIGDLIIDGERIVGDGINIAARIQALAKPGGVVISRTVTDQIEKKLPVEIHDRGEHALKNLPKPVQIFELGLSDRSIGSASETTKTRNTVPGFAGRHAIAVLPFQNLSQDAEQEYFADGLAEDLITRLSAVRRHPVIAKNSSFVYKGKNVDVRRAGSDLGAHYIVAGSVRRSGNRVRVSVELDDSEDGRQIWSERFDRQISDIFDLQDEIVAAIVASLGPALSRSEIRHAMHRESQNLDAWDCIHRGAWHFFQSSKEHNAHAQSCAREALERDPNSSAAYSLMAFCHMHGIINQWSESPKKTLALALSTAEISVNLDKDDPVALTALGFACALSGFHERAIAVLERAIELNPSSALAHWALGSALAPAKRSDEAIAMIEKAIRLSPQDPLMHEFLFNIGAAHFVAKRYEQAIDFGKRSLHLNPGQPGAHRLVTASLGYLGRTEEAKLALEELLHHLPQLSTDYFRTFLPASVAQQYVDGLRKAGWSGS
ncbi:MAG: adenylate/guanylate cyclase domain-containing protein [Gammaproteobacteria bacterium]|nr:adenylate/guanylate cyclase domain-containing protein [Gammaproteobacteria bacterium]